MNCHFHCTEKLFILEGMISNPDNMNYRYIREKVYTAKDPGRSFCASCKERIIPPFLALFFLFTLLSSHPVFADPTGIDNGSSHIPFSSGFGTSLSGHIIIPEKLARSIASTIYGLSGIILFLFLFIVLLIRNVRWRKKMETALREAFEHMSEEVLRGSELLKEEITERRQAEQSLREINERFRAITENLQDGILSICDGKIIYINEAGASMVGCRPEEITGISPMKLVYHEDLPLAEKTFADLISGKTERADIRIRFRNLKSDDQIYVNVHAGVLDTIECEKNLIGTIKDITDAHRLQQEIDNSEKRTSLILESAGEGIYGLDMEGRITFANPTATKYFGIAEEDLKGKTEHEAGIHWHDESETQEAESRYPAILTLQDGKIRNIHESFFRTSVNTRFPVDYTVTPIIENERTIGAVVVFRDITERILRDNELRLSGALFKYTAEAMMITDRQLQILSVNPAFSQITGYSEREVLGKKPAILRSGRHNESFYREMWDTLTSEEHWKGEIWNRKKSGEIYVQRLTISAIKDSSGDITNYVSVFSDITKEKMAEEATEYRANHDALTGLANRTSLMDRLENAINNAGRKHYRLAVVFIDLDDFKTVNDTYGHIMGDRILIEVAERLRATTRQSDTLARPGGDEFVIILSLEEDDTIALINTICRRVMAAIASPYHEPEEDIRLGASIGISLFPEHSRNPEQLIDLADRAMYEVKNRGGYAFEIYRPHE